MTDLVERLRRPSSQHCNCETCKRVLEAASLIEQQARELERLRGALREIYEVWAGSEGFVAKTAPEGYQQRLIEQMRDIARAALQERHSL